MQRVDPRGRSVRALVALFAASALLAAGFGGSGQTAGKAMTYLCPPAC